MTTAADDRAVEEAFEASLAGRPVPEEAAGLAAFTRAVRGTATAPGRPNAALADLLSTGLLTHQPSPSTETAPAAGVLPSRSPRSRTRRRFTVIVPALIAKFLSAGAIAQAATGAGVVVVVVAGAGTAGALPDGAQDTFSDLTGISETVDEPAGDVTEPGTEPVGDVEGADPAALPEGDEAEEGTETDAEAFDAATWAEGPDAGDYATFGAWVSEGAHNKAALKEADIRFGSIVSECARAKGLDDEELADELEDEGLDLGDVTDDETEATDGETESGDAATADDSKRGGKGSGKVAHKGSGKGNGGGNGRGNN
jgi:hypothetical protein